MQELALEILRDHQDPIDSARKALALCAREVGQYFCNCHIGCGVNAAGKVSAALGSIAIDHGDRNVAQRFIQIGLRVKQRIERDTQNEHREGRLDREDAAKLLPEYIEKSAHGIASPRRCGAAWPLLR